MRIAIASNHGFSSVELGWARAFEYAGHKVSLWTMQEKPAFDFFCEVEPELLYIHTKSLDRATVKNIISRPNLRLMLWGSHCGSFDSEIDRQAHAHLLATEAEKAAVETIVKYRPDVNFVLAPYVQDWVEVTHDRWRNLGLIPIELLPAADHFVYSNGVFDASLASDVAFIGNYHQSYGPLLLPLCREMRCKFFGGDGWPVAQYLGNVNPQSVKNILASAKVCPNIANTDYGFEISERVFHILAAGSLCINKQRYHNEFGDDVIFCPDVDDFHETVREFVNHPERAIPFIERGLKQISERHTYLHRLSQVSPYLGLS